MKEKQASKLNLDIPIIDERGNQVMPEDTVGTAIGGILIKSVVNTEGDILKYFGWANNLAQKKSLELDEADAKKLKEFIIEHKDMFVIIKAPAIKALDALKF